MPIPHTISVLKTILHQKFCLSLSYTAVLSALNHRSGWRFPLVRHSDFNPWALYWSVFSGALKMVLPGELGVS